MVIRVNPEKMLPDSWTITQGKFEVTQPDSKTVTREAVKVEIAFDYPAEGPADIYALGVPRDAPVEDRMPPPDLDRIMKIVQQNRRDFGDYLAVAGGYNRDESYIVHLIRCKGDKFRVDEGIGDTRHVASGDEMEQWWRGRGKEILLAGAALCDGRRVYEHNYVRPEPWWKPSMDQVSQGDGRTAAAARPRLGRRQQRGRVLRRLAGVFAETQPATAQHRRPFGRLTSIRRVKMAQPAVFGWNCSSRTRAGQTTVARFIKKSSGCNPSTATPSSSTSVSDCPAVDEDPLRKEKQLIHEYDDFRQTPRGLWYPTVSR